MIGTRCISYILYLSRPGKRWSPQLGGALELYSRDASGTPDVAPSGYLLPEFGSLAFFTVDPGVSYHSVQEVLSRERRLSISGARRPIRSWLTTPFAHGCLPDSCKVAY